MKCITKSSVFRATVLGLAGSIVVGCASAPATIDTSPEAELSFDGLYPVKGGKMDLAWARSDFSVEKYSKVMLEGVGIEYRPGGAERTTGRNTGQDKHFALNDEQKKRFQEQMREAFVEELKKGEHFELVTEPGPDVLLLRGGLINVTSFIPPDPIGRGEIFLSRVGEATLVFELRDSESGAILLRAVDGKAAENVSGGFSSSNKVTNSSEFRRVAKSWGVSLRDGLDRFMAAGDEAGE